MTNRDVIQDLLRHGPRQECLIEFKIAGETVSVPILDIHRGDGTSATIIKADYCLENPVIRDFLNRMNSGKEAPK